MSDLSNVPVYVDGPPQPFYVIWIKALTKPSEQTYAELAASPQASPGKAYLWIFLAGLAAYAVFSALFALELQSAGQIEDLGVSIGTGAVAVLCAVPIFAALVVLGFMIGTAIVQWIAGLFGGQGNYNKLAYVFGAIQAPYLLISAVITLFSFIPFIGILFSLVNFGILIYLIVLEVMAVKGVNRFGWGAAIGSVLVPWLVIVLLCVCVVGVALMLLGPAISEVFQQINQSIAP